MDQSREDSAVNAYCQLLKNQGGDTKVMDRRSAFFDKLIPKLVGKELSSQTYRQAVEEVMDAFSAEDWPINLTIAREFYPFWLGDFKAIGLMAKNKGFELHPANWMPEDIQIKAMWPTLDEAKLDTASSWALKSYRSALKIEGAPADVLETRVKFAKLLLIRLQDAPVTENNAYRIAVDATLPLFEYKETRNLFLVTIREFFYFWSGRPDAHERVMKNNKVSML